jgi:hypothetical protein
MSNVAEKFILNWHAALDKRSFEMVDALLAHDIKLISPVAFKPFTDRKYILKVLENVVSLIENFHYTRSTVLSDGGVLLVFEGEIDGRTIEGIDLFDLDEEGRVKTLKVMLRPFRIYSAFAFKMAHRLGIRSFKMKLLQYLMK